MSHPLKWEFPGGKVEEGESLEECLHREIQEELELEIRILERLPAVEQDYGAKRIQLIPFRCEILAGEPQLHEHHAVCWESPRAIARLDFAGADVKVLQVYLSSLDA